MPQETGKPNRKQPERADALKIDLPFEDAVRAALQTKPDPTPKPVGKKKPKP